MKKENMKPDFLKHDPNHYCRWFEIKNFFYVVCMCLIATHKIKLDFWSMCHVFNIHHTGIYLIFFSKHITLHRLQFTAVSSWDEHWGRKMSTTFISFSHKLWLEGQDIDSLRSSCSSLQNIRTYYGFYYSAWFVN